MSYGVGLRNGVAFALGTIPSLTSGGGLRPSLLLNFLSGSLDSRITFSRGTQATQYTSNGTLQYAPNNLLTYSNQADNAAWTKSNSFVQTNLLLQSQTLGTTWTPSDVSVNSNVTTAPDGTVTADEIVCTANALAYLVQGIGPFSGAALAGSIYLKSTGVDSGAYLSIYDETDGASIAQLTITSLSSGGTDVGNGWRRYTLTGAIIVPGNIVSFRIYPDKDAIGVSGVSRVYAWGAQLVEGSAAGDYRATTTATLPVLYADYNGVVRARKLCENTAAASPHYVLPSGGVIGNTETISIKAKAAERNWLAIQLGVGTSCYFDLSTGVLGTATGGTGTISSLGSGWYRCSFTAVRATNTNNFFYLATANTVSSYTGDGSSGIYISDAQLEAGSTVQAYNDTTSAAYYGPRFDYDPTNYVRQNLLTYSQEFDNGAWSKAAGGTGVVPVVTPNYAMAPDGTMTADRVVLDRGAGVTGSDISYINQTITSVPVDCTGSIWMRTTDGSTKSITFRTANVLNVVSVTGTWTRFTALGTAPVTRIDVLAYGNIAAQVTDLLLWGAQLNTGSTALTYTATTTAPYTLVAARGLLIEEQRANLLLQSNDFQTSWTPTNITRTLASTTGPDGTLSGVKIEATASGATNLYQQATSTATSHTFAVYCKQGTSATIANTFLMRNFTTSTNLVGGTLNYSTGVFTYTVGSTGVVVTSVGNGWWRIAITATAGITVGDALLNYVGFSGGVLTAGDFLYAYGAQLEAGAFATSYIPTVGSQVTRAADSASITTLTPWFNAAAGTLLNDYDVIAPVSGAAFAVSIFHDGTASNRTYVFIGGGSGVPSLVITSGGVAQANIGNSVIAANTATKTAGAYALNDFAVVTNGGTVATDLAGSLPVGQNKLELGSFLSGAFLNGHLRNFTYYPTRLPDASIKGLTV